MSVEGWGKCRVGELCESVSITHKSKKGQLIFLNTGDIERGKYLHKIYSDISRMPGQAKKSIKKGDILFSEIRPANGRYALVDFDAGDYIVSTKLMVIRCGVKIIPKYFYQFITSKQITDWLQHLAESRSGTFPQITFDQVADIEINLPDLSIQTRIAAILSALDDKIELNRQTNATLEAIAQTIFKEWFIDFRFPGATGEMENSELDPVPKGWRVGTLGELSYVQNGFAFKSKDFLNTGEIGIVKIKNIYAGIVDITSTQYISPNIAETLERKFEVKPEALLIAMTGAEVGKIGLMPYTEKKCWLNQRVGMFIEKIENSNWFIYMQLSGKDYQEIIRNSAVGSAQPNISGNAIESIKMLFPPEKIVSHFGVIVKPVFEKILYNIAQNHQLIDIRDSILPKLMSGEIEV